jgi:hypothetical protein
MHVDEQSKHILNTREIVGPQLIFPTPRWLSATGRIDWGRTTLAVADKSY